MLGKIAVFVLVIVALDMHDPSKLLALEGMHLSLGAPYCASSALPNPGQSNDSNLDV